MTDIEKVARAICKARYGHLRGYAGREAAYEREAQAAIAAMQPAPQWQRIETAPRSLMEQIRLDAALVAAMPEHERRDYERELKALFCNPGITFPTPPAGGSDAE